MKSNINAKADKNKIILSVGMIVKNEEKHLDNCLIALKRLLDRVPSELIIVDTGSTDRTKEIALKYTDKVYDFEWIDDFSAARNYGLEKAVGEWFMFVDADEYLDEDCDEMVKFFNMPEVNKRYNSASFLIVNYSSMVNKKKTIDEFLAPRVVRMGEGVRFGGKIHEWLPQPNPHGIFSTKFHHYGYTFEDKELMERKGERNVKPIIEQYKQNPKNLRNLSQLCDATSYTKYFKSYAEREKYHLEYLEEAKKQIELPFATGAFTKTASFYINCGKNEKALEVLEEFLEFENCDTSVVIVNIYYLLVLVYMGMDDYEKAYEAIKQYIKYYKDYKAMKLDVVELRFCTLYGLTDYNYEENTMLAARFANKLGKYDEALEYLDEVNLEDMDFPHLRLFLNIIRELVNKTHNYTHVARCYEKIQALGDDDKTGLALFLLQQYYLENFVERDEFVDAMIGSGVKGKFIELMKLVKADSKGKDISGQIQKFIDSVDRWNDGYAEAIYLGMKHGADFSSAIKKMSNKLIKENLQAIADGHPDYAKTALEYYDYEEFSDSIKKLYWFVTAFECGVEYVNDFAPEDKGIYFDTFVISLSDYVMNIYNPDLFNEDDVEVLPELHRFGYYMTLAFTAQQEGNQIVYIRMLKEALRLCESMKNVISYYLSEFEKTLK